MIWILSGIGLAFYVAGAIGAAEIVARGGLGPKVQIAVGLAWPLVLVAVLVGKGID